MCDECHSVWLEPTRLEASAALTPEPPNFRVPGCTFSTASPGAKWATRDEITAAGWAAHVMGEGGALDGG
jgi:hypothetical protein